MPAKYKKRQKAGFPIHRQPLWTGAYIHETMIHETWYVKLDSLTNTETVICIKTTNDSVH